MHEATPQPSEWKIITPEGNVSAIPTQRILEGSRSLRIAREQEAIAESDRLRFPTKPTAVNTENASRKLSGKTKAYIALGLAFLGSVGLAYSIKDTLHNRQNDKTMYITDSMAEGLRENLTQPGHYLEVVLGKYRLDAEVPVRTTPMLVGNPYNTFESLTSFGNQVALNTARPQSQLLTNFPIIRSGQEVAHSFNWGIKEETVNEEGKTELGFFPINDETSTNIVKLTANGEEPIDSKLLETVDCKTASNPNDLGAYGEPQIGCETEDGEMITLFKNPSE